MNLIETMSLAEMKDYRGRMDVPEDFAQFWQEQVDALEFPNNFQLDKMNFDLAFIDCYELRFKSEPAAEVYAKCIVPRHAENVPVIFYFHGYQGQGPDWSEMFKFSAAGFAVVCMDVRGQSGYSTDGSRFKGNTVKGHIIRGAIQGREHLFYREIYLDLCRLVNLVSTFTWADEERLYTYGASQGAALALVTAALNPQIQKTVAIYPFLSDFKRVLELGDTSEAYNELFRYFKFHDPFHETEAELLHTLSYIDVKNFAHLIQAEVKMITGLQDDVCPPSTQFAIYNRLEGDKELKIMPEYNHEAMNVKVNDLVFNWLVGSKINI